MIAPAETANRLEGAPVAYREPAVRPTLAEAQAWCKALATSHYENFHVATWFLPAKLRPHFHAVYAFCRVSDDLGDEVADRSTALRLLHTWGEMLDECYDAPALSRHPVYVALRESMVACDLPRQPFHDLIRAFRDDQTKTRFATLSEDIEYSVYSANPVGSLVLYVCGYREPDLHVLSDRTCTALQLANFWQDVGEDLTQRDRIYVPQDRMAAHGITEDDLRAWKVTDAYRSMIRELCTETRAMLLEGAPLIDRVEPELSDTLRLFTQGGLAILDAIAAIDYNTLTQRPEVSKATKLKLLVGAMLGKMGIHRGSRGVAVTPELASAYDTCRAIARREAKNFTTAFLALPPHKRDAMCAVYAFMRRADDISDDESVSLHERRAIMSGWLASWHSGNGVAPQDKPVFLAVRDVQQRYGVSDDLLDQLVQGTTMDLDPEPPEGVRRIEIAERTVDQYETMDALERYCYLVASVVGLTTIRIFGCTDPAADGYAVELGLAFQLTNILRDVREDAERGRVYLPEDMMAAHLLTTGNVITTLGVPGEGMRALMAEIAERAETLYGAADQLIPLLQPDSRAAMRVLVDIYHLLLKRIVAERFDVFRRRVRVSTPRKLAVLAQGLVLGMLSRGGSAA